MEAHVHVQRTCFKSDKIEEVCSVNLIGKFSKENLVEKNLVKKYRRRNELET